MCKVVSLIAGNGREELPVDVVGYTSNFLEGHHVLIGRTGFDALVQNITAHCMSWDFV